MTLDNTRFLLVHATPRDPLDEYLGGDPEQWARRLEGVDADIVCVGHTHVPFALEINGKQVVNPGSLGLPRDGDPRASYAVIEGRNVTLKRIDYPIEAAVNVIQASSLPEPAKALLAEVYRTGQARSQKTRRCASTIPRCFRRCRKAGIPGPAPRRKETSDPAPLPSKRRNRKALMNQTAPVPGNSFSEEVELQGHIVDSLILPKVLDEILTHGGTYVLKEMRIGHRQADPSYARIEVRAATAAALRGRSRRHPRAWRHAGRAAGLRHDASRHGRRLSRKAFTARPTIARRFGSAGEWIEVEDQEMDCGILLDPEELAAALLADGGRAEGRPRSSWAGRACGSCRPKPQARHSLFEFMASPVSSEKPKGVTVREIAAAMKTHRERPARRSWRCSVRPWSTPAAASTCARMIRHGYLNVLFAGNALATHDIEQALYGTSLGVSLDRGLPAEEGHEHHLRAINTIRRLGGIARPSTRAS